MFKFLLLLAYFAILASANLYTENNERQRYMWKQFKREHQRVYEKSEDATRFSHFLRNLRLADERNKEQLKMGGSSVHGITKYMDWSQEEIETLFNAKNRGELKAPKGEKASVAKSSVKSGEFVDWTGTYTTPVKDQGHCGSCWAFSATEQIESDSMRTLGKDYILAPQQITSCDKTSFGCNGGWTESAYNYVHNAGGIAEESTYPYTSGTSGQTGQCASDSSNYVVTVNKYYSVASENEMGDYVTATGPLSVCVDASTWSTYTGGVMTVCPKQVDHCVQAVGVQTGDGGYWKVRNSWGTSWGESGYIRLSYGSNTCAIADDATYTSVSAV